MNLANRWGRRLGADTAWLREHGVLTEGQAPPDIEPLTFDKAVQFALA